MSTRNIIVPPIKYCASTQFMLASLALPDIDRNLLFEIHNNNQAHLIFNRPHRMNALSQDMYFTLKEYILRANQMDQIKFIVIRGNGKHFSTGNDFSGPPVDIKNQDILVKGKKQSIYRFGMSIIESKKPILGVIQGNCIGFFVAILPLFDKVFATQDAYFYAPFVRLGLCPEIASSYTFPRIFGNQVSEQIITNGKPITSKTLEAFNVLKSFKNIEQANKALQVHIGELEQLDWNSYIEARKLMRREIQKNAPKALEDEIEVLAKSWSNAETPKIIQKHLQRQKSLKGKPRAKL